MGVVQYIVVREDLARDLGTGVLATQASHASMAPITTQIRKSGALEAMLDPETRKWVNGAFRKILLEVPDKDKLIELMEELDSAGVEYSKIEESTLNGELTGIGLKPYEKDRVAKHFKDLSLLGGKRVWAFVDGRPIDTSDLTYNEISIDHKLPDMNHRFILGVNFKEFVKLFGDRYQRWRNFALAQEDGSGNEYINNLEIPPLDHITKNDTRFNEFILDSLYQEMLNAILPLPKASDKPSFVITSLEGIFYKPEEVFIYGGCSKR